MQHEIGHMFGINHCTYYECMMNGSMSGEESDTRPSWLCVICLKKLHYVAHFDFEKRAKAIIKVCKDQEKFDEC